MVPKKSSNLAKEPKSGQMAPNTLEIGAITKRMGKENLYIIIKILTVENLKMTEQLDKEFICMLMEINMKDNLKMIDIMGVARKH